MAKRLKTEVTLEVTLVVGRYQPARPGYIGGAPEDCYPAEPEDVELEAVLVTPAGQAPIDIQGALSDDTIQGLKEEVMETLREEAEDAWVEAQIAREEARRDREEDR